MPYNTIDFGQSMPQQVPDYGQQDQSSLFQQIQQYQDFLAAQQEKNKQLGNNPSVLAGQYAGQNAAIAQQQSVLNTPAAPMQNYVPDTTAQGSLLQQAQAYMNMPAPAVNPNDAFAVAGARNYQQENMRKAQSLLDQLPQQTRTLSPDEYQAAQEKQQMDRINGANSMVNAIPLEQGVNPSVLGQFGDIAQKAGAEGEKSRTANILGQADIQKQRVANIGQIGAAQAAAEGQIGAAEAQYTGEKNKLTKATMASLEQGVTAIGSVMNQLGQLGQDYDPAFGSGKRQAIASAAGLLQRWGAGSYDEDFRKRFSSFSLKAEQAFNNYRKVITGAAASDAEIERLRKSYFNLNEGGPVEQKAKLAELLVQQGVGLYAATKALHAARNHVDLGIGDIAKPGTPEFGQQVDALAGRLAPEEIAHVRDSVLSQYPGLITPTQSGATGNGASVSSENLNARRARIAQELLSQQQQSQPPAQQPIAQPQIQQQVQSQQVASPQQFDAVRNRLKQYGR